MEILKAYFKSWQGQFTTFKSFTMGGAKWFLTLYISLAHI